MDVIYDLDGEYQVPRSRETAFPVLIFPPLMIVLIGLVTGMAAYLFWGQGNSASSVTLSDTNLSGPGFSPSLNTALNSANQGTISPLFTPEVNYWENEIIRWSQEAGLDPNLVATVMQIESCGDPLAQSSAGAMGLFQVMPFHFQSGEDPFQPETNALRGLAYLYKSYETSQGDISSTFAGYNGGIGVIGSQPGDWADETQRYVYWGSGIYRDASMGSQQSPTLQEWLSRGGASLCRQAAGQLGINP